CAPMADLFTAAWLPPGPDAVEPVRVVIDVADVHVTSGQVHPFEEAVGAPFDLPACAQRCDPALVADEDAAEVALNPRRRGDGLVHVLYHAPMFYKVQECAVGVSACERRELAVARRDDLDRAAVLHAQRVLNDIRGVRMI